MGSSTKKLATEALPPLSVVFRQDAIPATIASAPATTHAPTIINFRRHVAGIAAIRGTPSGAEVW
jgi:hypothetical protein